MKSLIFKTTDSFAPLVLRLMLGIVIFPHGAQKLLGWFGGYGFSGTMNFFTEAIGLPWLMGFLVIILESIGSMALLAGIATRIIAASYLMLALGVIFTSHIQYGFFMNWFGNQQGEGYEYFLLWIGMAASLILTGGGRYSIDKALFSEIIDSSLV